MIVLKDTGSDFFEEAYFVLKPSPDRNLFRSEKDFVSEARRIILANSPTASPTASLTGEKKSKRHLTTLPFLLGASLGAVMTWGLSLIV